MKGKYKYLEMSRHSWTHQEDEVICRLVSQHGLDDWTLIADKLIEGCLGRARTGKQCRQRWYNHLSPTVSKKPWSSEEQSRLFEMHRSLGNRWKDISRHFVGRTDNDIKNHFYSTLRRSLRRLNKILGEKNSTSQMREIKPSVLSTIMHCIYERPHKGQNIYESLKDLPSLIFEYANYKPIKTNLNNHKMEEVRLKIADIFELISRFNQEYERDKLERQNCKQVKKSKREDLSTSNRASSSSQAQHEEEKVISLRNSSESIVQQSSVEEIDLGIVPSLDAPVQPQNSQNMLNQAEEESIFLINYIGSYDQELGMMEMQQPEQPSLFSSTEHGTSIDLTVVGRHWQPHCWEKVGHEDFVDQVLQ